MLTSELYLGKKLFVCLKGLPFGYFWDFVIFQSFNIKSLVAPIEDGTF